MIWSLWNNVFDTTKQLQVKKTKKAFEKLEWKLLDVQLFDNGIILRIEFADKI